MRCALLRSRVQMPAASPYCEWFARRTRSAASVNGSATTTGPKISSRTMLMSGRVSLITVGCTK